MSSQANSKQDGASRAPKYPRYRAEKFGEFFIVAERCVRGFNYVYRNTGIGRFATREEAQAAIPKMVRA